ncbi:MAG: arginine--tRNA ligase [bacterium]|nr:arginine--tRNA ligase [bacterium]
MSAPQSVTQHIQARLLKLSEELTTTIAGTPELVLAPSHVSADLASNWPLVLFNQLTADEKKAHTLASPVQLAAQLATQLSQDTTLSKQVQQVVSAAPGFLNITLTAQAVTERLTSFVDASVTLVPQVAANQRILVEYADPNPFKEFHIGHLFNITVGETISRLLEAVGADVIHVCYQGDVGMHVAKSLWGMEQLFAKEGVSLESLAKLPLPERVTFLGRAYAAGATAYEDVPEVKAQMQEINVLAFLVSQQRMQREEGIKPKVDYAKGRTIDPDRLAAIAELYTTGRAWSLEYFDTIYARLGTKFSEHFFESQSAEYGYSIVKDHVSDGIFAESKGAIVFLGEEEGLHNRVFINSLHLPTYEAKDMGLPLLKQDRVGVYDRSIIVTANEIDEYFKVVLRALSKTYPELEAKTKHLSHGVVRLPEGKMSSRTGNIVSGSGLLDEAQQRVLQILAETQPGMALEEQKTLADKLAVAAVKYALLKSNLGANISFSFEESLSFTGNSGPYLEYTAVRCRSILQKAADLGKNGSIAKLIDTLLANKVAFDDGKLEPAEKDVLLYLNSYSDTVKTAATTFAPHLLCTYLFGLAQRFSRFYESCPILTKETTTFSPLQQRRLLLAAATARVLREGMTLLGMPLVEQM